MSTMNAALPRTRQSPLTRRQRMLQSGLAHLRPASFASAVKRALGVKRIVCQTDDGSFLVDPYSHFGQALTRDGCYEEEMCEAFRQYLPRGGVFADVGANEGYFSVIGGLQAGPEGRVLVVEPQSRLQPVINENLRLNGIDKAVVLHAAVSDQRGTAVFHLSPDMNTGASGLNQPTRYSVPTEEVQMLTLTDILAQAGVETVDLMKMDIEGFEDDAILGSAELFRKGKIRVLALELHRQVLRERGRDPQTVTNFLKECGYSCTSSHGSDHRVQFYFVWKGAAAESEEAA